MRDNILALWLRLLALHLPEPTETAPLFETELTLRIRNRWLLASQFLSGGCVPHGLADACATKEGRALVRVAIDSLLKALGDAPTPLDPQTLNLLGVEGLGVIGSPPLDRRSLREIGQAFLDLLDARVTCTACSTDVMPGSKPYVGTDGT